MGKFSFLYTKDTTQLDEAIKLKPASGNLKTHEHVDQFHRLAMDHYDGRSVHKDHKSASVTLHKDDTEAFHNHLDKKGWTHFGTDKHGVSHLTKGNSLIVTRPHGEHEHISHLETKD